MTQRPSSLPHLLACAAVAVVFAAADAGAQTATTPPHITFLYGVSGGPGYRTTSGTFDPSALPPDTDPLESDRVTATLTLEGGAGFGQRVAILGLWESTFGGSGSTGTWGTMAGAAVARFWLSRRIWVEGGGGLSELGHEGPDGPYHMTRYWAPGFATGVGAEWLKGRRVSVTALTRFTRATFEGQTINSVTFQVGLLGRE